MWCKKRKLNNCIDCKTHNLLHQGRGWCQQCYSRNIRRIKSNYKPPKYIWSKHFPYCKSCGTSERKHQGKGLCSRCNSREYVRKKTGYKPPASEWSRRYEECIRCETTKIPYESKGMCTHCYSKYRYKQSKYLEYKRNYARNRAKTDINYRLTQNLRSRLRYAIKNYQKKGKTLEYLGCSISDLKIWLEQQFKSGMTWSNYGMYGWHIDHVKPLAMFDLTNEEEIRKACNFKNLQPLWAKENWSKQNKYLQPSISN